MDYSKAEGKELLENPLIKLTGKRSDFIKILFFKIAYKKAKSIVYYQKEEVKRLKKREKNQTEEIKKLQVRNKELIKELKYLKQRYRGKH